MRDTELYQRILGLEEPWRVKQVELDVKAGTVDITVEHPPGMRWSCPDCEQLLGCHDHSEERVWRHLDSCQFKTLLHARLPRVDCPEHGVRQVRVPWAEPHSRFTAMMERFVIDVLLQAATVEGARKITRLSWDEVWAIAERAVRRGLAIRRASPLPLRVVGVDEKAFRKGQDYVTVVCDGDRGTVVYVGDGRTIESLDAFWRTLTRPQLEAVEAVTMDMWAAYIGSTLDSVPNAKRKIVFDRFHVMQSVLNAVKKVFAQETRALGKLGDRTLVGTKYLWLRSADTLDGDAGDRLESLASSGLKIARAWALKEGLRHLWSYRSEAWARRYFQRWYWRATHSRLPPMQKLAHRLRGYLNNILTFCRLRVTNAVAEGINSKIMAVKRRAAGYRNPEHFKTAIHFFCGGLQLHPR